MREQVKDVIELYNVKTAEDAHNAVRLDEGCSAKYIECRTQHYVRIRQT